MGLGDFLRGFDFFRSIAKREVAGTNVFQVSLTQKTLQGTVFTWCSMFAMVLLFLAELNAYMTVTNTFDVGLSDTSVTDATLMVNLNISLPHLPCKFASVDISDVTHTHRLNITKNVRKFGLSKSGRIVGEEQHHETEKEGQHEELPDDHPIHQRESDHSTSLTPANFDSFTKSHDIVLVNFFAPWCHWCRKLEPVWEHTASELQKRPYKNTVTFAKVNCVEQAALCRRHLVRAFPTILTYQQGHTDLKKMYRGDRSTKAFLDYVEHLDFVATRMKSGQWDKPKPPPVPADPVGESEGCMITGHLSVKRVPGSVVITAHSEWHNFDENAIDVSHTVNHFSFGTLAHMAPRLLSHMSALDGSTMDAKSKQRVTHHHYLKVVETVFAGYGTMSTYQFTKHSHSYVATSGVAEAKFQFDLDPMVVRVGEDRTPFYKFITSLCAIIGGTFTVIKMLDGVLYRLTQAMSGPGR